MKVYGITNCNTVKKALDWLKQNNVSYEFQDFKKLGVSTEKLTEWDSKAGYQKFMNKQGLTYKQLDPAVKESITINAAALNLLQQKTSMIKRPVIEDGDFLFFGFDEAVYQQHFNSIKYQDTCMQVSTCMQANKANANLTWYLILALAGRQNAKSLLDTNYLILL